MLRTIAATQPPSQVPTAPAASSAPSVGDRIGETASAAGKHLGEAPRCVQFQLKLLYCLCKLGKSAD